MNTDLPDDHTLFGALELANRAPSVHNTQPWRWLLGDSSIHLMADPARQLPVTDPAGRDLVLSCGAALHHLRVAMAALGWDTAVQRVPNHGDPTHLAALEVSPHLPSDEDIALAAAISHRRTDRRRFSSWPVPEGHLDLMVRRATEVGALLVPVTDASTRRRLTRAIDIADRMGHDDVRYQMEVALWSGRSRVAEDGVLSASSPRHEHVHGDTTMRTFPRGSLGEVETGRGEPDAGQLLVLATPADDTTSLLRAGEAASAALLTATDLGLATCPLSQPLEIADTRALIRDQVLDGAALPHLVVRTGWLPTAAPPLPHSPRRPTDKTVDFLPGTRRARHER
ncbi:Acg family FMN-binding oxidoreductase [Actinophytocola gossypii]|uniref:NAD(P)H nitroreductase n=1 Tax=Actinophytocola gossypii TaxID=2812003 RepID=A0ABT2JKV6_9PSEU|nr:NAD(P)H nitroreductase [Actinophytocola gossypii]MCT2587934.1 NAD(P)H nitroreductase [Actinophytocola gossypii]